MDPRPHVDDDARRLRYAVAFVWLATALSVLHPTYRALGAPWLARLGLPEWLMPATCVGELALGAVVALWPQHAAVVTLQAGMIATFTVILASLEPLLLASPFGMLTKNIPIVTALAAAYLAEREGWSARASWLLRAGVATIWLTEGLFPKILFQQAVELELVAQTGVPFAPSRFLQAVGAAQALSGLGVLLLRGPPLRALLAAQAVALVALPLIVSWQAPWLWVHPFGPLIKNVPILVATLVGRKRWSISS